MEENYSEKAVWLCKNLNSGYKTKINGELALILKKYPADYELTFLKWEGPNGTLSEPL